MDLKLLAAQLRKPEGETGKMVVEMMNKGNLLLNQWAIEALELKKNDKVLELGMANGFFTSSILSVHPGITYTGVDFSELMVQAACELNQSFIIDGKATYLTGDAARLPFEEDDFNKFLTVNTVYFWESPEKELAEIRRILQPEGLAVFGIRSKKAMDQMPFTQFGFRKYDLQELQNLLTANGFHIHKAEIKQEPPYQFEDQTIIMEDIIVSCNVNHCCPGKII